MEDVVLMLFCFSMMLAIAALQGYMYAEVNGHGNQEWVLGLLVLGLWSAGLIGLLNSVGNLVGK